VGVSLVKGVIKQLPAYGLCVQSGAVVGEVVIDRGRISTEGDHVITVQVQGEIGALRVSDGIEAQGHGSEAVQIEGGAVRLQNLDIKAADGVALRLSVDLSYERNVRCEQSLLMRMGDRSVSR